VRSRELDLMICMGPFQFRILYESVTLLQDCGPHVNSFDTRVENAL